MEDVKKVVSEKAERPELVKKEIARRVEEKTKREEVFLKKYDEVLNKHILNVFRKTVEETERSHDHRALKIVNGEVLHLRLDCIQGQAEGIKVDSDSENHSMYLWFSPDPTCEKMVFKFMYEGETIYETERYSLDEVDEDFFILLIGKKYFGIPVPN